MDFSQYEGYEPVSSVPWLEKTRDDAETEFAHLMSVRSERIAEFTRLCERNGYHPGCDERKLAELCEWLSHLPVTEQDGTLAPDWLYFWLDLGLFLGECLIERAPPGLRWGLSPGGISRHSPVIVGLPAEAPRPEIDVLGPAYAGVWAAIFTPGEVPAFRGIPWAVRVVGAGEDYARLGHLSDRW